MWQSCDRKTKKHYEKKAKDISHTIEGLKKLSERFKDVDPFYDDDGNYIGPPSAPST